MLTTTTTYLAAVVQNAAFQMGRRLRDESGQTAAEYMGVIVVVAAILAAVVGSGIGGKLTGLIEDAIQEVFDTAGG